MRISKSIQKGKIGPIDFLKQLEEITELLLSYGKDKYSNVKLDSFELHISFPHESIDYETYEEFKDHLKGSSLSLATYFWGSIYINKKSQSYENILYFRFDCFTDDQYIELSIGRNEYSFLEESFSKVMQALPGFKILKHNPRNDQLQQRKNTISKTISILQNLNRYQLRMKDSLKNEKELQNFLFPILKSHFKDLEEEFNLPKFGTIAYQPDFGIPSIKLLLECKFLKERKDLKRIQKEVNDDAVGYLKTSPDYRSLIVFIYNSKNTPIPDKFQKDLKRVSGINDVIIVPGIDPK